MTSKIFDEWEGRYQANQIGWDRGEVSNNLHYWLEDYGLKSCRILIPGCGNGYEVLLLAKLGFDVVAIDIAPTPIENLQKVLEKENLHAELILGDFFEWQATEKFDVIFEQTSLCALPPKMWKNYVESLYGWLKPEGKLLAAFMQTGQEGGPPYHCELADMSTLFSNDKWIWSEEHTSLQKEPGKTERLYILEKV